VLAQLRANAREQHGKAKRLGHVVVGTGLEPEDGVGIGIVPSQHDDRRLKAVLAQDAHRLPPVDVGKPDIHDHEMGNNETSVPSRRVLRRNDRLPDRPQRQPGKLQVRPGEWDAHDGHSKQDRRDQVTKRQPPSGQQQPHNVADHP
jgi:hypothetical protein